MHVYQRFISPSVIWHIFLTDVHSKEPFRNLRTCFILKNDQSLVNFGKHWCQVQMFAKTKEFNRAIASYLLFAALFKSSEQVELVLPLQNPYQQWFLKHLTVKNNSKKFEQRFDRSSVIIKFNVWNKSTI